MSEVSEQQARPEQAPEELPKAYRPTEVEREIYQRWLDADVFAPDGSGSRADRSAPPFVVTQPPPNITGALHTGHALTGTLEDAMVRRARMQRRPTLWLPGLDHASIAAQVVLDRILALEGESRQSMGRDRYLERMWWFIDETRDVMLGQERRMGFSLDWARLRFTMDEGSARAVRVSFKRLYDEGLAYRAEKLINWCPSCRTSLSDLEVIATPETGTLWFVRYHLLGRDGTPDPSETITVATTRPETILGDTAVAVHPDDERYSSLVGREVLIPFVNRRVPVIADHVVQREFGSGAVKITPAHDDDDHETGRRHGLPSIEVMDDRAAINANGGPYEGLSREEARRRIVADLEKKGDLAEARAHEMVLGRCERSDDVVEPRLKTQWFVRTRPLADKALAAVREGRTTFVPARFEKVFFDWLEKIHDWNVSRQLWWGHRIPAWYCPDGHVTVSDEEGGPAACERCGRPSGELAQDEDIFDTWYSSGLWPFSTLGWPDPTDDYDRFYPTTVMETGYDIIFFWVARMMMLGEWLTGEAPFATVYLHGMVRDPYGQKMSKTKGNVVDPLSVVEEVGADALRFALVNGTTPGNDQRLSETRLEGGRNFANKLWNAARFVLLSRPVELPADALLALPSVNRLGPAEHWILSRCAATTAEVDRAYDTFQLGEATRLLHEAIWNEYCDWYLEFAKVSLTPGVAAEARVATWSVLVWVLDRYLHLLHPVMPHLTEAIWARLPHRPGDPPLLIVANWPDGQGEASVGDPRVADATRCLMDLVTEIRNARAEAGIEAGSWLSASLVLPDSNLRAAYEGLAPAVARLARVRPVAVVERPTEAHPDGTLVAVAGIAEARLSQAGADLERDRARLERELAEARKLLTAAEARLENRSFIERAPPAVVEGAMARAAQLRELVDRLSEPLAG